MQLNINNITQWMVAFEVTFFSTVCYSISQPRIYYSYNLKEFHKKKSQYSVYRHLTKPERPVT